MALKTAKVLHWKHQRLLLPQILNHPGAQTMTADDTLRQYQPQQTPDEQRAALLIDSWTIAHGKQCPWKIAVEITAICTGMTGEEINRLLALGERP